MVSVAAFADNARSTAVGVRRVVASGRSRRRMIKERHRRAPTLGRALTADVAANLHFRGEGRGALSKPETAAEAIRLMATSDAFLAQVLYRSRSAMLRHGIPVLPRLCHGLSMVTSQVCIGDPVVIGPGLYLPHGQVVVDGVTDVGADVILFPWTTIGLRGGNFQGPTVADGVHVGTGSKVIGPVQVGQGARIGANAVVVDDVAARDTVVGVPGRSVSPRQ